MDLSKSVVENENQLHGEKTQEMYPVEHELIEDEGAQEGAQVKPLKSPMAPSRQEVLEHNITHYPFRSWCTHCVRGKCKASKHSTTGGGEESEIPVVGFDYAFLSDRIRKRDEEEDESEEDEGATLKVLIGHDSKSKVCTAIPVPQKGIDVEEWSVRESLRFLDFLGYQKIVVKSDQEEALNAVIRKVRQYRGSDTQTMQEHSPVGSSQSNGATERRIQTIEGQVRTLRSAFESRIGAKVPTGSCLFAWLVIHAGNLITLYETGRDGRVPFQRLRGRKMHPDLLEFGERVMFQPLDYKQLGSAQPKWEEGVFVGIKMNTSEKLVATPDGVCKTRSIKRRRESERWDADEIAKVTGTPWKPYLHTDDDQLRSRAPEPVIERKAPDFAEKKEKD